MKYEPNKSLAEALKAAKDIAEEGVIEHSSLNPKHFVILKKAGCLTPVIRGWYLLTKPEPAHTSTIWYVGFWPFIKKYLLKRFGKQGYCLSADASLDLHTGENHIARQITAITKKTTNQKIELPEDTSLLLYTDSKTFPASIKLDGIYVMPLPLALCRLSPSYFKLKPLNVEIALKMLVSVTEVSRILLEGALVTDAGRLAGAFRALGDEQKANQIIGDMAAAGLTITETNPFETHIPVLGLSKIKSPYTGRIEAMWKTMRIPIIEKFPSPPGASSNEKRVIKVILERYTQDAYNSLSIEGYEVTEELIQKIADGKWSPDTDPKDQEQINAMAAKGYYEAFQKVLESVRKVIGEEQNSGEVFEEDLQAWYRALFSPSVQAGIIKASDLAGYRNGPVYIKKARHVPPGSKEAVVASMETLFELMKAEEHPAVRAILGHFIFVYIHPYMDGNGRIGRFILNLMLISGGYSWTVIRNENRNRYMQALDAASSDGKIEPFANFVLDELNFWANKPPAGGDQ